MSNSQAAPRTVLELLRLTTTFLQGRGIDTPRLDAEVLLAHVLKMDRVGLYVNFDRPLQPGEVDQYRTVVARRARREPVAYIVGQKEFMGKAFRVTPAVLIPRPETELLVERAVSAVQQLGDLDCLQMADIGTGSGAIAVMLALLVPKASIVAVDISTDALAIASENAVAHGVSDQITFMASDLLSSLPDNQSFHCIVSNPPYIPADEIAGLAPEVRQEPRLALEAGPDGLQMLRKLISEAPAHLVPGGLLMMEIGAGQGAAVRNLAKSAGYADIQIHTDYAGRDRIVEMRIPTEQQS